MRRELMTLSFGVGALILAAAHAFGQTPQNCAPRAIVLERLADKYGESRQSIGLGQNNQVVEVFASLETGSWSITVTMPQGITCLVASGQSFENLNETLPEPSESAL